MWAADGATLYYRGGRALLRVAIEDDAELRIGTAERVAAPADIELAGIAADGRLLVRRPPLQPTSVTLVLGWTRELRPLLGPPPAFVPR